MVNSWKKCNRTQFYILAGRNLISFNLVSLYQFSLCEFLSVVLHLIIAKWCRATQGHGTLIGMCHLIILWFRSQRTHLRESLPHLPAQIGRKIFRIRTFSAPPQTDGSINLSLSPLDLCCQRYQGGGGWRDGEWGAGGRLSWGFCQSAKSLCNTVANPSIRSAKSTLSQQPFCFSSASSSVSQMVLKKIMVWKEISSIYHFYPHVNVLRTGFTSLKIICASKRPVQAVALWYCLCGYISVYWSKYSMFPNKLLFRQSKHFCVMFFPSVVKVNHKIYFNPYHLSK